MRKRKKEATIYYGTQIYDGDNLNIIKKAKRIGRGRGWKVGGIAHLDDLLVEERLEHIKANKDKIARARHCV